MVIQRRASVADACPTLNHHWVDVWCLMNRTPPSIEIDTPLKRRFIIALWIDQITVLSHIDYDVFLQNEIGFLVHEFFLQHR